jgi:glutamate racemase
VASDLPIGVFDSGVGGLTVLRALRRRLPAESLIYLGDTARLPYGTKSVASVERYASQATEQLVRRGVKMLVVACNTASAVSLDPLRHRFAPLPVIGVVVPGADAAVAASRSQHHLVLATESTVKRHAYAQAIRRLVPEARVDEQACSLFVALAEEGWTDGAVPESVAHRYLAPLMTRSTGNVPDTVVLGCTHFPLLEPVIRLALGPEPAIVDSASTTAVAVACQLETLDLLTKRTGHGSLTLLATDGPDRFASVGSRFLDQTIAASDVEVIDL